MARVCASKLYEHASKWYEHKHDLHDFVGVALILVAPLSATPPSPLFFGVACSCRVLTSAQPRVTQFTGSSKVAEILVKALDGKVRNRFRVFYPLNICNPFYCL